MTCIVLAPSNASPKSPFSIIFQRQITASFSLVKKSIQVFHRWLSVKEFSCNVGDAGDMGSIPGLGRSPGEENGNPFQYSCLGNPMVGYSPWGHKESDTTEYACTM